MNVEYNLTILGEFRNKEIETEFLDGEVKKGLKLIRYMLLFASIANLLIGIPDYLLNQDMAILYLSYVTRLIIVAIGIILFFAIKRIRNTKTTGRLIYAFAFVIYVTHLYVASHFTPVNIMFETFNLVILSTCLFLLPNRWIANLSFSLAYFAIYIVMLPHICTAASVGERIITICYVCWNTIIISILFYRINIYKRNHYSKNLQLKELANTDHLTKIHNRKACDEILKSTCMDNSAFSFIMFDIDDFKQINDTHGHVVGDEVIVTIIRYVRTIIRKNDIIARWGGEEFVIIMPDAKLNEARELALRVKEQISQIKHNHIKQSVTCSFGVTEFATGDNAKTITSRADQLLYLAKEYGKNRVVVG